MKIYSVDIIADYFRSRTDADVGDLISNLKLQKLCYYAAGVMAAARQNDDRPLFAERIEAWQHGPVVPSLYHSFKEYGSNGIPPITGVDFSEIDARDRTVLDDVYNYYGQYSAWKLRNMTHEEAPWLNAYEQADGTITTAALREFFIGEFDEDYLKSYQSAA
ncbi:Panacea domain-containing protein [Neomegalonema sp.]|uniref:Panacea domain-containing protein n=1 Tax=Neomegalonema sp. TaxID=2039713 RepID=UPI0026134B1D|nr:type II toxin-antitoxin system antitoxin SocA domain-containing protein [Neomegalonema sp.]MDD2870316.1 DUF4065 domain-containing protein [Neomegalonema sp.]